MAGWREEICSGGSAYNRVGRDRFATAVYGNCWAPGCGARIIVRGRRGAQGSFLSLGRCRTRAVDSEQARSDAPAAFRELQEHKLGRAARF
jgi:hypothetical protein